MSRWIIVDDIDYCKMFRTLCGEIVDSRWLHYKPEDFLFCPKCKTKMEIDNMNRELYNLAEKFQ